MDLKCECPHCGTRIAYTPELCSTLANCPSCAAQFQLPDLQTAFPGGVPSVGMGAAHVPGQNPYASRGGFGFALSDPMDSQTEAMNRLGKEGTLTWGFLLCLAFPVATWLAFWRGASMLNSFLGAGLTGRGGKGVKFLDHVEAIVTMSIFVALLFGVLVVLNALNGRKSPVRGVLFTTGMIVLPLVCLSLYGVGLSFLKIKSADAREVIGYFTTFVTLLSMSSLFLLLFAAITSVLGFSRKAGFWLVPATVMATFVLFTWISKLTSEIGKMG